MPATGLLVLFQQREIHHPQRLEDLRVAQAQQVAQVQAQLVQLLARLLRRTRHDAGQVALLQRETLGPQGQVLRRVELVHRALQAIRRAPQEHDARGSDLRPFHEVDQRVGLLAAPACTSGGVDAHHQPGLVEHLEAFALGQVVQLVELHAEAQVRLVAAVVAHGLGEGHPGEGLIELQPVDAAEEVLRQALEGGQHVLLLHEGHLAIDLGELRLAVGPQVLVAEALHQLEVAVEAGHHQQLLEGLRALGQGVELARVHAARHHEVAGALRRALDQHRGLHLQEALAPQEVAHLQGHAVAQFEVPPHVRPAQVQVAVLHPQFLAAVGLLLDGEGWGLGPVQHLQLGDDQFDLAGGDLRVLAFAFTHRAGGLHHEFAPQLAGLLAQGLVALHVEAELGDAEAVAEVHEGEAAQVAGALDPSGQGHGLAGIGEAELAAGVGAVHGRRVSGREVTRACRPYRSPDGVYFRCRCNPQTP